MLPYLEQAPLYASINFFFGSARGPANAVNTTAYNALLAAFICPSDGNTGVNSGNINNYFASQGTTTYNCCNGNARNATGIFAYERGNPIAKITDGTSNTIAFSESLTSEASPRLGIRGNVTGNIGSNQAANQLDISTVANAVARVRNDAQLCTTKYLTAPAVVANPTGTLGGGNGSRWGCGAMGYAMFNTVITPNGTRWSACRMDCCVQAQHAHYVNAMSNHPGGVNVLMADGSVKFIKDSINQLTYWALGTKDSGEVISSDAY
jgi:prepilin-type processing-associated H-X9-DG protein